MPDSCGDMFVNAAATDAMLVRRQDPTQIRVVKPLVKTNIAGPKVNDRVSGPKAKLAGQFLDANSAKVRIHQTENVIFPGLSVVRVFGTSGGLN